MQQPPKSCDHGKGNAQKAILPKEHDSVESVEETFSRKVEEGDEQPFKNFVKDEVHTLPFELIHSDENENEEEEEGSEEGEIVEKGASKRKREDEDEEMKSVKRARRKALWEGFGEEGEFSLRSGRLYDSEEWVGKDW